MNKEIIFVAGARPNFMKIAPILRAIKPFASRITPRLIHTGQHYDASMSEIFFSQLGIEPPYRHLEVGSGSHAEQTARVLSAFEAFLLECRVPPAGVVVVGDVNSTVAASLAAVKLGIPVAHVEAGLRSFDRSMPEEINRILTDAMAELLLVSEPSGLIHLAREGIAPEKIHLVGNVMIDTLAHELPRAHELNYANTLGLTHKQFAFVTLHRPSNVDHEKRLSDVVEFLNQISKKLPIVFPLHPRTLKQLERFQLLSKVQSNKQIFTMEPLGYHQSLSLMSQSKLVITDSGGIQEETSFLGVPCLTLRPNTERPVTITLGTSTLVGEDLPLGLSLVEKILNGHYKKGSAIPLWDGNAAARIVSILLEHWIHDDNF